MRPKKLPEVLTRQEVRSLLAQPNRRYPTGLRNYTMMLLMYRAGLRVSEVIHLEESHINRSKGYVRVVQGKGAKDRVVPVEVSTVEALEKWLTTRRSIPGRHVFCTLKGEPLDDRYIRQMVAREGKAAGIDKRCHPHMLRHTYATEVLDDGLNIREVQELLGHADVSTTMIYTHVNPVVLSEKIRARKWEA